MICFTGLSSRGLFHPLAAVLALLAASAVAQAFDDPYEREPINYSTAKATDPVARFQEKLDAGSATLKFDDAHGYLRSLLDDLKIPVSSQALVFSKTSLQRDSISPKKPRAIYFNDDVYVGFTRGGHVLEVAATDRDLGVVFYTLDQREGARPRLLRQTDSCLQCHGSSMTRDTPGLLVRSVYSDRRGLPVLTAGTFLTTHESPLKERWGGWYVTGTHGDQRHMGNAIVKDEDDVRGTFDTAAGANVTDLSGRFDTSAYLSPHSDMVALMVLEHQANTHNLIARANYATKLALRDEKIMNEALGRPADFRSEGTVSRIKGAGEPLVKYMLFSGETPLTAKVAGTSTFAAEFTARGPRDKSGRSLREFDLRTRMFKYPLSFLICSDAFDGLPTLMKEYVYQRLHDVLTGKETGKDFAHLSDADRKAVLEILRQTKSNLPAYW